MSERILAIDAGNTRIKWGVHDGQHWLSHGAVDTTGIIESHALADAIKANVIDRVVISNVAGTSIATAIKDQIHFLRKPVAFIAAQASSCGVTNRYDNPAQLGSDRWAALVAAHTAAVDDPCAQLVVMCGTALTIDALTVDGQFLGGIIAPGLKLMHRALNQGTAQLPSDLGEYRTFPRNTANAITAGSVEACAGAIERMYKHLAAHVGDAPYCIGSGGAIHVLAPHLPFPVAINDNLVLDGLVAIASAS
jgi:type III pantothenate kinase